MSDAPLKAKRPLSVTLLLGAVLICFLVAATRLPTALSDLSAFSAWLIFYVCLLAGAFWNIVRRRNLGRKLGLVCIGLFFSAVLFQLAHSPDYSARPKILRPANAAEEGGAFISRLIMLPLMGFWFYRFGFSNKSKAYFGIEGGETGTEAAKSEV